MVTAIYSRVSTEDQKLDPQIMELSACAESRGWTIAHVVTDVISGSKSSRTGLDSLMELVRQKKIGCVMVVKIDRLARSLTHFVQIVHELRKNGVALVVPGQGVDTSNSNPAGRMLMNMLGVIADFERDLIRERTVAGMAAARARGAKLGHPSQRLSSNWAEIVALHHARHGATKNAVLAFSLGGVSTATAWKLLHQYDQRATA